jgi:hypothetical protein
LPVSRFLQLRGCRPAGQSGIYYTRDVDNVIGPLYTLNVGLNSIFLARLFGAGTIFTVNVH